MDKTPGIRHSLRPSGPTFVGEPGVRGDPRLCSTWNPRQPFRGSFTDFRLRPRLSQERKRKKSRQTLNLSRVLLVMFRKGGSSDDTTRYLGVRLKVPYGPTVTPTSPIVRGKNHKEKTLSVRRSSDTTSTYLSKFPHLRLDSGPVFPKSIINYAIKNVRSTFHFGGKPSCSDRFHRHWYYLEFYKKD